mmetsp:Transcript_5056/g.14650  ORF Transcript_5056/g.14650 Transcript_5056/m.14650 type:complete len:300 (+) Transcript_5056:239-1138(+)
MSFVLGGKSSFPVHGDPVRVPTQTLRDVLSGHLEVDTTGVASTFAMHVEESNNFFTNGVEAACLESVLCLESVSVNRVTHPNNIFVLGLNGLDDGRQLCSDSLRGHSRDEGDTARDVVGVESVQNLENVLGTGLVADFHSQGIFQSTHEFEVGEPGLSCSFTYPKQVSGGIVVLSGGRVDSGHGFFVRKQKTLVRSEEIDLCHGRRIEIDSNGVHESQGFLDNRGQLSVLGSDRCGLDEIQSPGMEPRQVGVSSTGESTQDVQGLRTLVVGLDHSLGIGLSGFRREWKFSVDVVSLVGW